jgi:hypothetical protein
MNELEGAYFLLEFVDDRVLTTTKRCSVRCQREMDGQHIICRLSECQARGHPKSQQALEKYCSERIYTLLKLLTSPREQDTKTYQFCNNFVGLMSMSLGCCWVVDDVFKVLIDVDAPPHY